MLSDFEHGARLTALSSSSHSDSQSLLGLHSSCLLLRRRGKTENSCLAPDSLDCSQAHLHDMPCGRGPWWSSVPKIVSSATINGDCYRLASLTSLGRSVNLYEITAFGNQCLCYLGLGSFALYDLN